MLRNVSIHVYHVAVCRASAWLVISMSYVSIVGSAVVGAICHAYIRAVQHVGVLFILKLLIGYVLEL